jgi:hypothetical protein
LFLHEKKFFEVLELTPRVGTEEFGINVPKNFVTRVLSEVEAALSVGHTTEVTLLL